MPDRETALKVLSLQGSLVFRIHIYDELSARIPSIQHQLADSDVLLAEIRKNRLACYLVLLFMHCRLSHHELAAALVETVVPLPELNSAGEDWQAFLNSVVERILLSLGNTQAVQFADQLPGSLLAEGGRVLWRIAQLAKVCDLLARHEPATALHLASECKSDLDSASPLAAASWFLEARCRSQLVQPAEELRAYKSWRIALSGDLGRAAANARERNNLEMETLVQDGAKALCRLAQSAADGVLAKAIIDEMQQHGYNFTQNVDATTAEAATYDCIQISPLKPLREQLAHFLSCSRASVSFLYFDTASFDQPRNYAKEAGESNFFLRLRDQLQLQLEDAKDNATLVELLEDVRPDRETWILCTRDQEFLRMGIQLKDQGSAFTARVHPVAMIPAGLPSDEWLKSVEPKVPNPHSKSLFHHDLEKLLDRSARLLTPDLAPTEVPRKGSRSL
jgi:hypothetical protein